MNLEFLIGKNIFRAIITLVLVFLFILLTANGKAQNLAVNTDGSKADPNAILDIKSTSKGLLIPRMTTVQRIKIPQTNGLMVYDITTKSFWYSDGSAWKNISVTDPSVTTTDSWLLMGNAGTVDGTNFLGTTDNVPLNIRVNNQKAGRLDPIQRNTFWGYQSGTIVTTARDNTGIGTAALFLTTTGFDNTALGANTLQNNSTGFSNTAVGRFALYYNNNGAGNTAVGTSALLGNISGMDNTAVGGMALSGSRGNSNTAVGSNSQIFSGGDENTSLGASSLAYYDRGAGNTAVGYRALGVTDHTSSYNTAVGHSASISPFGLESFPSYCTVIGYSATAKGNNSMALGNGALAEVPNKVRIGNAAITVIEGQVPFTTPSDGRYKFNIREDVKGLDFILKLRPVTYQFDVKRFDGASNTNNAMQVGYDEATQIRRTGFIAQEVEKAAQKSGYNFSGIIKPKTEKDHYSLSYESFVVPLVKAVQEQQSIISAQQEKIDQQNKQMSEQEKRIQILEKKLDEIAKKIQN